MTKDQLIYRIQNVLRALSFTRAPKAPSVTITIPTEHKHITIIAEGGGGGGGIEGRKPIIAKGGKGGVGIGQPGQPGEIVIRTGNKKA